MEFVIFGAVICAVIILWMRHASKKSALRKEEEDKSRGAAIKEGAQAAKEGRGESSCPYRDSSKDPGNKPIGVLAVVSEGFEGRRFWWLAGYRQELRGRAKTNQPAEAAVSVRRETATAGEFLAPLTQREKLIVTGLSPRLYKAVIDAKNSGAKVLLVDESHIPNREVPDLLVKLDVADLERLVESLELTLQADSVAASDFAEAAKLYQKAFAINPYDAVAAMSCGVALAKEGDMRGGLTWIQRAHDLAPDNPRIANNLAAIKSRL